MILVERSIYSNQLFAKLMYQSKLLNNMEWIMYQHDLHLWQTLSPDIDAHIFLQCDVDAACRRIIKRGRKEETSVNQEFQMQLLKEHHNYFENTNKPVIYFDSNNKYDSQQITKLWDSLQQLQNEHL